jgi:GT2 family glycosyltransferase
LRKHLGTDIEYFIPVTAAPDAPTLSIVLVTFNAWEHTQRCLSLLLKDNFSPGLEIILVDNNSSDGTTKKARAEFPDVIVVDAGENIGFGRGCNLGMALAQGEFGVLLNNDAMVSCAQLEELLRVYRKRNLKGIYTTRIIDEMGNEEASCFREISPGKLLLNAFRLMDNAKRETTFSLAEKDSEAMEVDCCSGAFMLFPREGWVEVGGFDENFFMYYEDVDLCTRWRARGYKCHVNTLISIRHACGGSSSDPVGRAKEVDKSQRYFYRKHYGIVGGVTSRLFQIIRSAPRFAIHGLLGFSPHQRKESRLHFQLLISALKDP